MADIVDNAMKEGWDETWVQNGANMEC